jgi:hypothetical protein
MNRTNLLATGAIVGAGDSLVRHVSGRRNVGFRSWAAFAIAPVPTPRKSAGSR